MKDTTFKDKDGTAGQQKTPNMLGSSTTFKVEMKNCAQKWPSTTSRSEQVKWPWMTLKDKTETE